MNISDGSISIGHWQSAGRWAVRVYLAAGSIGAGRQYNAGDDVHVHVSGVGVQRQLIPQTLKVVLQVGF